MHRRPGSRSHVRLAPVNVAAGELQSPACGKGTGTEFQSSFRKNPTSGRSFRRPADPPARLDNTIRANGGGKGNNHCRALPAFGPACNNRRIDFGFRSSFSPDGSSGRRPGSGLEILYSLPSMAARFLQKLRARGMARQNCQPFNR